MAQVTLYLDEETLGRMRRAAKAAGVSTSAWLSSLVKERTRREWPAEVAALAGAWPDLPDAESLRRGEGTDVRRGKL